MRVAQYMYTCIYLLEVKFVFFWGGGGGIIPDVYMYLFALNEMRKWMFTSAF